MSKFGYAAFASVIILALSILNFSAFAPHAAAKPSGAQHLDGKTVFLNNHCDNCHSVSSAGITGKSKTGPDLIDVTGGPKHRHDIPWERKFIRQNETHPHCSSVDASKDGKKHPFLFKGTQEEEDALVDWLDKQRSK